MTAEDPTALLIRADALIRDGRTNEGLSAYAAALERNPAQPDGWYDFGLALRFAGRYDDALDAYRRALDCGIASPEEVHLNRAVIYADHLRNETAAQAELASAVRLNPDFVPAILNLGGLAEDVGDRDAAIAHYESIAPTADGVVRAYQDLRLEALARLAHLAPPVSLDDPALKRLADHATSAAAIAGETRANLNYALGRTLDALGAYDRAIAAFHAANKAARSAGPRHDRARIVADVDAQTRAFPGSPPAVNAVGAHPPLIFICGMFRSGSTLVEQALAAHADVVAGGELNLLSRIADVDLAPFPQSIRMLTDERATALAARYRSEALRLFPEAAREGARVTDKRPDNFLRIGLIKRLFPDAKIVHTVRNPVDTCLSVYFQHIDQRLVGYASDLADAGHYYGEYRRMMAHWKTVFADEIFDFDYDRFVADPHAQLAALLSFLGLPWSDRCLSFHELRNTVKTASYWQVRRPLYRESSGRRRHYEAHLGPLLDALRAGGVEV